MQEPGEINFNSAQPGAVRAREIDGHLRTWPTWALRHNTWIRGDQEEKVMVLGMDGWLGGALWVLD